MAPARGLGKFGGPLCRRRALTQHIGLPYAPHRFLHAACGGKWVLTPPLRSQTSQTFWRVRWEYAYATCFVPRWGSRVAACRSILSSRSGTDSRKRTFHRGRAKPHGTATSQISFGHTVCHRLDTTMRHQASWTLPGGHGPRTSPLWTCFVLAYMSKGKTFLKCIFPGHCWQKALGLGAMWATTHGRA